MNQSNSKPIYVVNNHTVSELVDGFEYMTSNYERYKDDEDNNDALKEARAAISEAKEKLLDPTAMYEPIIHRMVEAIYGLMDEYEERYPVRYYSCDGVASADDAVKVALGEDEDE